jgi:DNA-directed RNA polymerase specialized sigma24 family protein
VRPYFAKACQKSQLTKSTVFKLFTRNRIMLEKYPERANSLYALLSELLSEHAGKPTINELYRNQQIVGQLKKVIDMLSPIQKSIFMSRKSNGKDYGKIGIEMQMPITIVKGHMMSAVQFIKAYLLWNRTLELRILEELDPAKIMNSR